MEFKHDRIRVIKYGLLYDTDDATLIYTNEATAQPRHSRNWLFRTKRGRYFNIHQGALSDTRTVNPMTETDVKTWLASESVDEYIRVFGHPERA